MLKKSSAVLKMTALALIVALAVSAIPFGVTAERIDRIPTPIIDASEKYAPNATITPGQDDTYRYMTWYNETDGTQFVKWVEADKIVDGVFPEDCYQTEVGASNGVFRAKLTDLKSDTDYAYMIGGNKTGWSEIYNFSTGDTDDNAFSFLLFGDPQVNTNVDGENWNISLEKAKEWFGDDIEFILSVGDQTNDGGSRFEIGEYTFPDQLRRWPMITVVGNHDDRAVNYSEYVTYTDVDQETVTSAGIMGGDYWVEYDGVLIISLNYQKESFALHRAFIEKAIEEYTALHGEPLWKIVAFHDSRYSAADSRYVDESESRTEYSHMFSELGIDAALMGHDHIYTRTYMIKGMDILDDESLYGQVGDNRYANITDPEEGSVVYFTANSGSGSKFYEKTDKDLPFSACSNQENVPNLTKIDVTADSISFTTHRCAADNEIGDIVDFFAIHRTKGVEADVYAPALTVPRETRYYPGEELDITAGVTAYDNRDKDLTDKIEISGEIVEGVTSTLTYSVTDAAGNIATVERKFIPFESESVVNTENTEWKYLDDGSYPFEINDDHFVWTREDFDDSQWKTAKGAFGSINGELGDHNGTIPNTLINLLFPEGSDEEGSVIPNFFFRTEFDVADPESVERIIANFRFDDAIDIYINGVMVANLNCFTGGSIVGYSGNQRDDPLSERSTFMTLTLDDKADIEKLNLKPEGNILAVEIYQGSAFSDDIFFDFENLIIGKDQTTLPFTDVKPTSWYYANVAKAYSKGLFAGVTETTFEPKATMTRAMVWTVLAKTADIDLSGGKKWYSKAQEWATENGVSDGTMPKNNITRQEIVTMLYSLAGKPEVTGNIDSYTDKDSASSWAVTALSWAVEKGVMTGRGEGILAPKADLTRAEACTLILKYLEI